MDVLNFNSRLDGLVRKSLVGLNNLLDLQSESNNNGLDLDRLNDSPRCKEFLHPKKAGSTNTDFTRAVDQVLTGNTLEPISIHKEIKTLNLTTGNKLLYLFTTLDFCFRIEVLKKALVERESFKDTKDLWGSFTGKIIEPLMEDSINLVKELSVKCSDFSSHLDTLISQAQNNAHNWVLRCYNRANGARPAMKNIVLVNGLQDFIDITNPRTQTKWDQFKSKIKPAQTPSLNH